MKFSHIADCHIGSYRDERMSNLTLEAFKRAVENSIAEKVDFILISGDLFNTSIPSIDSIKETASLLRKLYVAGIPVYVIAGSHDFSPSGKTMLDVFENSGLCKNVARGKTDEEGKLKLTFTVDETTDAKMTGVVGRRGSLERSYYEAMDNEEIENASGFKIFMFHSAITELKPKGMEKTESSPISYLPKGFNYYAGGHVHSVIKYSSDELGGVIAYPGPLFPNTFKEIEDLEQGGFYIFDSSHPDLLRFIPIRLKEIIKIGVDATMKSPEEVLSELHEKTEKEELTDKIVLIRIWGKLGNGNTSDVKLGETIAEMYEQGAFFILRNTASLTSESFEEMRPTTESLANLEHEVIEKNTGQMKFSKIPLKDEKATARELVEMLDIEKQEGETSKDFEERVLENASFLDKLTDEDTE
ncbi:MAG: exonuclease SbcCD subunit D [Candidatus Woesearchaeota archaeon]